MPPKLYPFALPTWADPYYELEYDNSYIPELRARAELAMLMVRTKLGRWGIQIGQAPDPFASDDADPLLMPVFYLLRFNPSRPKHWLHIRAMLHEPRTLWECGCNMTMRTDIPKLADLIADHAVVRYFEGS